RRGTSWIGGGRLGPPWGGSGWPRGSPGGRRTQGSGGGGISQASSWDPLDGCAGVGAAGDRSGLRDEGEAVVAGDPSFSAGWASGFVTQVRRAAGDEDLVSPVGE